MTYMKSDGPRGCGNLSAMTRAHKKLIRIATLCSGLLPAIALAHPGHGEQASFAAGALHPLGGLDHLAGFIVVGILAAQLSARVLWPIAAGILGMLVAASTSGSDGWQYAAGFLLSGASLVAAALWETRAATRLIDSTLTAAERRSTT